MGSEGNKNESRTGTSRGLRTGVLLLAVLHLILPSSATSVLSGISRPPVNISVADGKRAEFTCGIPKTLTFFTFTLFNRGENHTQACHEDQLGMEIKIPDRRLTGKCKIDKQDMLASWVISPTNSSDGDLYVVCQHFNQSYVASLTIYDAADSFVIIIGCTIGGFISTLLFFGVAFRVIRGSEKLQKCFRAADDAEVEDDDDDVTMAEIE